VLKVVERLDTSAVEAAYSSLGRRGYHPKSTLAIWVYASLVGLHHSTKVARAIETDAAFRLLARGGQHSGATLRRFRKDHGVLFAAAIEQTVAIALADGLIDERDLSADSVRLRAHASTKAVRTKKRSLERLRELASVVLDELNAEQRSTHEAKVRKHEQALAQCAERGAASVVLTSPSAALMKFPSGAGLPGHRATVVASGQTSRFVVGVLVDAATNDYGKLESAVQAARGVLERAGLPPGARLQIAADAGYWSEADLVFAAKNRADVDVLIADPRADSATEPKKFYSRHRFTIRADGTAVCPAGTVMQGPYEDVASGRTIWRGVGCDTCPQRAACTDGRYRTLTASTAAEAMRSRLHAPGGRERYNRRIATVEPVFSTIEDAMSYRRVSTRHSGAVHAEILLKILAYNIARLIQARRLRAVYLAVGPF
jgi:transposase